MSSFRRPLSWLFIIASASLDLVGAAAAPDSNWLEAIVVGQLLIVGCWPALARTHRLAGAAVWLAAMLAIAGYSWLIARVQVEWRYVLGTVLLMCVAALVLTYVWRIALRLVNPEPPRPKFQFPIVEFFGWTIVVAVAAIAFREAMLDHLKAPANFWPQVAIAGIVALWMALFLGPSRLRNLSAAVLAAFASALVFLGGTFAPLGLIKEADATIGVLLYVAGFIAVVRMDESRDQARAGEPNR